MAEGRLVYKQTPEGKEALRRGHAKYRASPKGQEMAWRSTLRRSYGITKEQYDAVLIEQAGRCALCDNTDLHVDHCHTTGEFRGLLCRVHNVAIGALGDNEAGLLRALAYVRGVV